MGTPDLVIYGRAVATGFVLFRNSSAYKVFVLPTAFKLKDIQARQDSEKAVSQGDAFVQKFTTLNTVRMGIIAVGCSIGLKELFQWPLW